MTERPPRVLARTSPLALEAEPIPVRLGTPGRQVAGRFFSHRLAQWGLVVLTVVVVATALGGWLWPYGYSQITDDLSTPPSWEHPMGTDALGRDLLAGVLQGTTTSLQVAVVVALVSTAIGACAGAAAGYFRGWVDGVIMRLTDVALTVPGIAVLAVLAASVRRAGNWIAVALILSALSWTAIARIVRAMMLSLREREFVQAARAAGASHSRIVFRHLLPHAAGPIAVKAGLTVGAAILAESALSFLGLGISPPDTSLGILVAAGQHSATTRPWLFYFPGLVILAIVLSVNLVSEGLRAALDPAPATIGRSGGRGLRWRISGTPRPGAAPRTRAPAARPGPRRRRRRPAGPLPHGEPSRSQARVPPWSGRPSGRIGP